MTSIGEKRLARALKDATEVGLSKDQVRLIQLRIRTLNDIVAREHDVRLIALEQENQRLRAEIDRLQPKMQGDPEIRAALRDYEVSKNGGL